LSRNAQRLIALNPSDRGNLVVRQQCEAGGDTSQKQIAQSLGYKDVASFARVFRKATGLALGAYRKRFGLSGISPADFARRMATSEAVHIPDPPFKRPVSQQPNQIGQGRDRVILRVTQRFGIAAQQPIHLRGPDRTGGQ